MQHQSNPAEAGHGECAREIGACLTCGTPVLAFDDTSILPVHGDTGSPFRGSGDARHQARTEAMCVICDVLTESTVQGHFGSTAGRLCDDCQVWADGNVTGGAR